MSSSVNLWCITLCLGVCFWFYSNLELKIDYERHSQLVDSVTGKKAKPRDLLDLAKVINLTDHYIETTSAQDRLYDMEYLMKFESPFVIDQSYSSREQQLVSGGPVVNQTACGQQLSFITNQIKQHRNYTLLTGRVAYELTNLMDTFGRPEAGTYSGVINWMGSYKNCLKVSLNKNQIKTRYCIGRMRPKSWPKKETIYPKTSIRIGLCLPETCDTNSIELYKPLIDGLAKVELPESYKSQLDLDSMFCLPDERSEIRKLPTSGYIYLAVIGTWIGIVLLASLLHEYLRKRRKLHTVVKCQINQAKEVEYKIEEQFLQPKRTLTSSILKALSLRCSIKLFKSDVFKVKHQKVRVHLGPLDFFKIMMAVCVVLGHSGYLNSIYTRSHGNRINVNISLLGRFALSLARIVDTFFLIFGLLTTYTLMRKFNHRQLSSPFTWMFVNLNVFLRLTPLFMLVYWYSRSISPYTGSGPWWDYGVDKYSMKGVCLSDAWWKSIPYFGSIGTPSVPTCVLPAWFIVSYMQIFLIIPIISYLICMLPSFVLKIALVAFLTLASVISIGFRLYFQTSVKVEGFTLYGAFLTNLLEKFESTGHITTLGRIGAVAIGCFVGYLLRLYEEQKIVDLPAWLKSTKTLVISVLLITIIAALPVLGYLVYLTTGRFTSLEEFVGFNVLLMIVWPILNAILIINITTVNNNSIIVRFMRHTFWHVFNRLGLGIFLVHWEIIFIGITGHEQAPSFGFVTDVMKIWLYGVCIAILLAFLIHIFVESPLSRLITVFFSPKEDDKNAFSMKNSENNNSENKTELA